ncbi:hypothetical protein CMQ_5662 [Grosmannia clavigera kw1407]|uniref:Uncharacterized protein n=1 Tax=Grosmannia clavigera (strain kw1407 / UAMH 11150) TaxID=655863 RepID=F0XSP1_GROCL|nr:uncharacterized protein CMQ_5662 [Grosmannia clavigera kw1407]EFW99241.1 hypothetical protein CMQ_5662 [Grosmannia clavigera kw1407]
MAHPNVAAVALSTLSARETELLILAMQCFVGGEPKIDHPKFAAAAGLASPKGGMDSWYRIRKKLGLITTPAAKTPLKKEEVGTSTGTDAASGADAAVATPKRARTKRKAVKKEETQDQDDGDAIKTENDNSSEPAEPPKKKRTATRRHADTAVPVFHEDNVNGPF